jgi:hypothetical protein
MEHGWLELLDLLGKQAGGETLGKRQIQNRMIHNFGGAREK